MLHKENTQNADNTASTSHTSTPNSATDNNLSLEEKASQVVDIIQSDKPQQEKSEQVWEILKDV